MKKIIVLFAGATLAFLISAAEKNTAVRLPPSAVQITAQVLTDTNLPPFQSVEEMQAEFHRRFLASPGFGRSRIMRPIFLAPTPTLVHNGTTYRVVPPDLIGLEDEPSVYAAREHDFVTAKTNSATRQLFRTRPMDATETKAVAAIRRGREVVVASITPINPSSGASHGTELRVVGSLRADASCAKCHQCEVGKLLGAFTYTLRPMESLKAFATNAPALSKL